MGTIIGVHFFNRIARLCFCDAESVSVAEVNLPSDIKRLDIAANEYALKKAFEVIDQFLKEKAGITNYSLVIAISDEMGLKEIQGIYKAAHEFGVNVVRTVTETLAMAYFSYVEYGLGGNAIMAFVSPAKLGISEYFLEEGIVKKLDTYMLEDGMEVHLLKVILYIRIAIRYLMQLYLNFLSVPVPWNVDLILTLH